MECIEGDLLATILNWLLLSLVLGLGFFWLILPYSRNSLGLEGWAQFRHFIKASLLIGLVAILIAILAYDVRYC